MIIHNGKKVLSVGRDTNVQFLPSAIETEEFKWWRSLAAKPFLRIIDVHDCEDDSIVNVAGIVGMISSETKRVRSDNKELMTMRLTDRTGFVDVRSWNHAETEFKAYLEKPLLLQRIRVTSYAGIKVCELLDGNGTNVVSSFLGQEDLEQYWQE
jgi:DNA polymerase III alpha subunit